MVRIWKRECRPWVPCQGSNFRRIRRIRQPDLAGSAPDSKLPDRLQMAASRLALRLAWPGLEP